MNTRALAIALVAFSSALAAAEKLLVIKAGTAYPVSGEPVSPAVITVKDGLVASIDKEIAEPPKDATILSVPVAIPGIIDAWSAIGVRRPASEESGEVTPRARVADTFDPASPLAVEALAHGVTLARISAGPDNVVSGLGAVVRTYGPRTRARIVREEAGLDAALGEEPAASNYSRTYGPPRDIFFRRPTTRMGVFAMFRETFDQAREAAEGARTATADLEVIGRALKGSLPLYVHAADAIDIRVLIAESKRLGIAPVLVNGVEAHREADAIAAQRIAVVLSPRAVGLGMRNPEKVNIGSAGLLARRGVKIALASGGEEIELLLVGAMAVRTGLAEDAALRALTLWPAEIVGIAAEYGTLEPGKRADLVLLSGPPFAGTTRVVNVIGGGSVVFPQEPGR